MPYVLAGRLQVTNAESGEVFTYEAGAFIVEMIDTWHRGSNIGSEPVRLLVIDQVERGSSNTIARRHRGANPDVRRSCRSALRV